MKKHLQGLYNNIAGGFRSYTEADIPMILTGRILKLGSLSFLFFFCSLCSLFILHSREFTIMSMILGCCILGKCRTFYRIAKKRQYEIVEGEVVKTQSRYIPGRFYKVYMESGGQETTLLLDKNSRLYKGRKYRLYFSTVSPGASTGKVGAYLTTNSLLGWEQI